MTTNLALHELATITGGTTADVSVAKFAVDCLSAGFGLGICGAATGIYAGFLYW